MLTKSFFPCFLLLLLPCVFANVRLGRKITFISNDVETKNSGEKYAVVFDAGSTGTRVHVFHFDSNLDLLQIKGKLEIYAKVKPGLSSYASDPEKAALSIAPLLQKAVEAIPVNVRSQSLLQLGIAMNYLLGFLGDEFSKTVGIIDLGGASVQMAYAISTETASSASKTEEEYITKHHLKGINYHLYVHSYLRYGEGAARTLILQSTNNSINYCILSGYDGKYIYNAITYNARSSPSGSNFEKCRQIVLDVLNVNAKCETKNCTFDGVWNGGGGPGQDKLYLASGFFYRAADVKIIDRKAGSGKATPSDFKKAARATCAIQSPDEAINKYPNVWASNLPFICLDLVYQYTLLTTGFGLKEDKEVTVIKNIKYDDFNVEAAWPLGSTIETVSSMPSTKREAKNMYCFWSHASTE